MAVWYKRKWVIVLLHAAAWTLLFLFPVLLQKSLQHDKTPHITTDKGVYTYITIFTDFWWMVLFYLNAIVLIPKFIYQKRFVAYGLVQLVIVGGLLFSHYIFFTFVIYEHRFSLSGFFLFNIFPYVFILACSTAYRFILDKLADEQLIQQKETLNLKTELSFLRSQVNPHFMFNVLNNMVALARKKSDLLEPSLIQLSSLLRYMLYETDEQKVPLEKELEYLNSYIDLQRQRFGKKLHVNMNVQPSDDAYEIEPMLLIPFVENAFKHGTGMVEDPIINICLSAEKSTLLFTVKNKYNSAQNEIKDKTSGIGLANVERRLNLLYGATHTLEITKHDGWFVTSLQLKLH